MKKILFVCFFAVMTVTFVSCTKERVRSYNDGSQEASSGVAQTSSLAGTSWYHDNGSYGYERIYFESSSSGYYYDSWYESYNYFTYTYSGGSGTLYFSGYADELFNISGNSLYINGITFTKE